VVRKTTKKTARDTTNRRKVEHIEIITSDREVDRRKHYFDEVRLRHRALPEINLDDVDTSTTFMGKKLRQPLLISCMTGGDHDVVRRVNRNLAEAAERCGVALGVGSQRVMFTNRKARASFALRAQAPTALLFANLGAVQLNKGFTVAECREAVDVLEADGLYLHLNPLQEAVQPEGDTQFGGLVNRIGQVVRDLHKPVILKEVGAGISAEDVQLVLPLGIRYLDVAGCGGTSWSRIEHHRHPDADQLGLLFQDWGIPTPRALWELRAFRKELTLVASGGVRSGVDMAKAIVLGASLCGVASPFLAPALRSADAVVKVIERLRREMQTAMFLLGVDRVDRLWGNDALLLDPARECF
jgi:isopentenyl-diphosphate delta-isomerase